MKKILVAEDDKFLANAYRVKLTKSGFDVQLASDGSEVIKLLPIFLPDLLILDIIMPVKDGFTTLSEIKSNPAYKDLPIIVASNLGQKEDVDKAMSLGATDFIVKSDLHLEDLITMVNKLLSGSSNTA
jgi:two-component system phosphate regulon response regulator PhoB/two-component system alkaline phosphatase synthesis response regulator PhoP